MKHTKSEICDLGLDSMLALLKLVGQADDQTRNQFFQKYFCLIFDETLYVMTEQTYVSGFHEQAQILNILFQLLDYITVPIETQDGQSAKDTNNKEFMAVRLNGMLCEKFQNMNAVQLQAFVINLFNKTNEWEGFKDALRDFMIQMKQMSSTDEYYI